MGAVAITAVFMLVSVETVAASAGSISGTVTDAVTHDPVALVPVCAVIERFGEEEERFCSQTDAAGEYEVGELVPGEYAVEFMPGTAGLNYLYEAWNDQRMWVAADPVTVEAGAVQNIDAELSEGGELKGRIVNALSGVPVGGVEVCAEPTHWEVEEGCAVSDPAGEYTIFGLGTDNYRVGFFAPEAFEFLKQYWNREPSILDADPVGVTVGAVTDDVDATLVPGARISGTVTDAITRVPLARVSACTFQATGNEYIGECGQTDTSGHYTIRRVPAGLYNVRFFPESDLYVGRWYTGDPCSLKPVAISAFAGQETSGIDVSLADSELLPCLMPPEPEKPRPLPIEIRWIKSRSDGKVAVALRVLRAGTVTFEARTRMGSFGSARRIATVASKRVSIKAGPPTVRLAPNRIGRKLLRVRGRFRATLAILYEPFEGTPVSLKRRIVFKLRKRG